MNKQLRKHMHVIHSMVSEVQLNIRNKTGLDVLLFVQVRKGTIEDRLTDLFTNMTMVWDIPLIEVQQKDRDRDLVYMRKVLCMAGKNRFPKAPYKLIARMVGLMDHSSAMHAESSGYNLLDVQDEILMKYYSPVKSFFYEGETEQQRANSTLQHAECGDVIDAKET